MSGDPVHHLLDTDPSEDDRWGCAVVSAQPVLNRLAFNGYVIRKSDGGDAWQDYYPDLATYFDDFRFTGHVFSPREIYWRCWWSLGARVEIRDNVGHVLWNTSMEEAFQRSRS